MSDQCTVERIDALLPQTQCTRCGYEGCRPYAEAVAGAQTGINRCPPGGSAAIEALAALLGREPLPLDPACGSEADPGVAWIDQDACIGCARCLPPCPVDAIIGAQRYLHTVLEPTCTGCALCIASCPVDCIVMRPRAMGSSRGGTDDWGSGRWSQDVYCDGTIRITCNAGITRTRRIAEAGVSLSLAMPQVQL